MKGTHIVKRKGHTEMYDEKKVYASVYAAALNCHYDDQKAEKIAQEVTKKVDAWAAKEEMMTSIEIKFHIIKSLKDEHVSLMYKHHEDIC